MGLRKSRWKPCRNRALTYGKREKVQEMGREQREIKRELSRTEQDSGKLSVNRITERTLCEKPF